ncbi:ADOP family duplicated permease [Dokdonella sp. MW10]|uniref:ADOP family duplicated permease n=1 Tax=Dokdonella sp. MW10 TaxID=2992926 RepID=UPI003F7D5D17
MNTLHDDLRHALRALRAHPGTHAFAMLTLACGLAAALAILCVVEAVLLRGLPFPNADRVVQLRELSDDGRPMALAMPNYRDLAAGTQGVAKTAFISEGPSPVGFGGQLRSTSVAWVGDDFFGVFGLAPSLGRTFDRDERGAVAVISHAMWRSQLNGREDVLGQRLDIDGTSVTIVAVMPAGFAYPGDTAVWTPAPAAWTGGESRTAHNWDAVALLDDGAALGTARLAVAALATRLQREHAGDVDAHGFEVTPLADAIAAPVRSALLMLAAGTVFLLAIAISNALNLLLTLAAARSKEFAVRTALGASRARLARQVFLESLAVSLAATLAGLAVAWGALRLLVHLAGETLPRAQEIHVSASAVACAFAGAVVIAVILSIAGVLGARARAPMETLRESGRGQSSSRATLRSRKVLLVAQTALTTVLLVGAGLLGRSFVGLLAVDPGFRAEGAIAIELSQPGMGEPAAAQQAARRYAAIMDALAAQPGITAVGGSNRLPLTGGANGAFWDDTVTSFDTPPPTQLGYAEFRAASAGYFDAAGIPLLSGRAFDARDREDSQHVAVISATVAQKTWPGRDPIGQRIQVGNMDGDMRPVTIIGIVGDVHERRLERTPMGAVYVSIAQRPRIAGEFSVVARTTLPLATTLPAVRTLLEREAIDVPSRVYPLAEVRERAVAQRRFNLILLGVFAGVAFVLATGGLYGLMAFAVGQRRHEFALRQALGASSRGVLDLVLRDGMRIAVVGIVAGLAASLATTRLFAGLLYGVPATDLVTLATVAVVLAGTLLLASLLPARRASRVMPREALA